MKINYSNRKSRSVIVTAVLGAAVLVTCILIILSMTSSVNAYASAEETASVVKVFVGDIMRAPSGYAESRLKYISQLASYNPEEAVTAVVGFDKYYPLEDISSFIGTHEGITINRLYMWPEGETGRLSLYVDNGNIMESIKAYLAQVEENGLDNDEQSIKDHQRFLNGEYGVFAVTVTCSVETLHKMVASTDRVLYADIKYNAEAEDYAKEKGKDICYIELPTKPDGLT